mgnify:CR=1 FL=1
MVSLSQWGMLERAQGRPIALELSHRVPLWADAQGGTFDLAEQVLGDYISMGFLSSRDQRRAELFIMASGPTFRTYQSLQ